MEYFLYPKESIENLDRLKILTNVLFDGMVHHCYAAVCKQVFAPAQDWQDIMVIKEFTHDQLIK